MKYIRQMVGLGSLAVVLGGIAVPETRAMTLDQARALAEQKRPALNAARAGYDAARAALRGRRGERLPAVTATLGAIRMDDPAQGLFATLSQQRLTAADLTPAALNHPDGLTDLSATLSLEQPLYTGGRLGAAVRGAGAAVDAAHGALEETENHGRLAVTEAYYGYVLAGEALKVVESARETARAHLKLVNDRLQAGAAVRADLMAARARVAQRGGEVIEDKRAVALARVRLAETIGVAELPSEPLEELPRSVTPAPGVDVLLAEAREQRPAVAAAEATVRRARAALAEVRSGYLPEVALVGAVSDHRESLGGDAGQAWHAGATARWRLADPGRAGRVASARAELARAEAELARVQLEVRSQVVSARMSLKAAVERLAVAEVEASATEEGLRLTRDRYRAGAALLNELQEAEDRLEQANLARLSARHDLAVAEAALAWAVGRQLGGGHP